MTRFGYLGPEGTFTHRAAIDLASAGERLVALDHADEVIAAVRDGGTTLAQRRRLAAAAFALLTRTRVNPALVVIGAAAHAYQRVLLESARAIGRLPVSEAASWLTEVDVPGHDAA